MMDRLESIDHAKFRALSQIILEAGSDGEGQEAGIKAFEEYMDIAFPGNASKKTKKEDAIKEQLKWWINRGPVKFTPMPQFEKKGKSRMVHRIQNVSAGDDNKLYQRLKKYQ